MGYIYRSHRRRGKELELQTVSESATVSDAAPGVHVRKQNSLKTEKKTSPRTDDDAAVSGAIESAAVRPMQEKAARPVKEKNCDVSVVTNGAVIWPPKNRTKKNQDDGRLGKYTKSRRWRSTTAVGRWRITAAEQRALGSPPERSIASDESAVTGVTSNKEARKGNACIPRKTGTSLAYNPILTPVTSGSRNIHAVGRNTSGLVFGRTPAENTCCHSYTKAENRTTLTDTKGRTRLRDYSKGPQHCHSRTSDDQHDKAHRMQASPSLYRATLHEFNMTTHKRKGDNSMNASKSKTSSDRKVHLGRSYIYIYISNC